MSLPRPHGKPQMATSKSQIDHLQTAINTRIIHRHLVAESHAAH
jgi:hypothetical protein